jgi:hypothetical protein
MSSTLAITSGAVFNKVLLFMLKEADGIFRRMLGLAPDTSTAAAAAAAAAAAGAGAAEGQGSGKASVLLAEQVTKAQRWRKVRRGRRRGLQGGHAVRAHRAVGGAPTAFACAQLSCRYLSSSCPAK